MSWELIWDSLPKLLAGAGVTVQLTLFSLAIGLLLAVPLALARLSHNPLLKYPTAGFVFYFRGTPLLVQLFLIYYGSGQFREFFTDMGVVDVFSQCVVLCGADLNLEYGSVYGGNFPWGDSSRAAW